MVCLKMKLSCLNCQLDRHQVVYESVDNLMKFATLFWYYRDYRTIFQNTKSEGGM